MARVIALILFAAVAFAQGSSELFSKAPPEVDRALRARITEFYQDHITGKTRQAEALVAEDTKDFFYTHDKPKYLRCDIGRIEYSDDFTRAKATINCDRFVTFPGFGVQQVTAPEPSLWKVADGQWYWYIVPKNGDTPFDFGKMVGGTGPGSVPVTIPGSVEEFYSLVKADKQSVSLAAGDTDSVSISNAAPGVMTLSLSGKLPGIEATFDHAELKAGERATLTVRAAAGAKGGNLAIHVAQTGQDLPLRISVK
jgi:hypothetical protein